MQVTATLRVPGDLNGKVIACADRARAAGIASPRPFDLMGLKYCDLDTNTPGVVTVSFHLTWPSVGELGFRMLCVRRVVPRLWSLPA